jgi:hypothetical protein
MSLNHFTLLGCASAADRECDCDYIRRLIDARVGHCSTHVGRTTRVMLVGLAYSEAAVLDICAALAEAGVGVTDADADAAEAAERRRAAADDVSVHPTQSGMLRRGATLVHAVSCYDSHELGRQLARCCAVAAAPSDASGRSSVTSSTFCSDRLSDDESNDGYEDDFVKRVDVKGRAEHASW